MLKFKEKKTFFGIKKQSNTSNSFKDLNILHRFLTYEMFPTFFNLF